jgi:hypothetical protein
MVRRLDSSIFRKRHGHHVTGDNRGDMHRNVRSDHVGEYARTPIDEPWEYRQRFFLETLELEEAARRLDTRARMTDALGHADLRTDKAIENALGADKAGPVIQALESVEERVKASMAQELATKQDLKDLELRLTVRMGAMLAVVLAVVAALKLL